MTSVRLTDSISVMKIENNLLALEGDMSLLKERDAVLAELIKDGKA